MWAANASHLVAELMKIGPPPVFRAAAENAIRRAAEANATGRRATTVEVADVVGACLSETPVPFRPKMLHDLKQLHVDVPLHPRESTTDHGAPQRIKEDVMEKMEVNYRATSDHPDKNCGKCVNFQPQAGSRTDGTCFGHAVTTAGLCNFYTPSGSVLTQGR